MAKLKIQFSVTNIFLALFLFIGEAAAHSDNDSPNPIVIIAPIFVVIILIALCCTCCKRKEVRVRIVGEPRQRHLRNTTRNNGRRRAAPHYRRFPNQNDDMLRQQIQPTVMYPNQYENAHYQQQPFSTDPYQQQYQQYAVQSPILIPSAPPVFQPPMQQPMYNPDVPSTPPPKYEESILPNAYPPSAAVPPHTSGQHDPYHQPK